MLLDDLKADLTSALKKGDGMRVGTLRFLLAAVNNFAIAKYGSELDKLTDEDVLEVIKKQVKTHKESVEAFTSAGRHELADKEKAELQVLESYLPAALSDEELRKLLEPVIISGETNFGLLMKNAMTRVQGQAEGGRVSAMLKSMLQPK